MKKCYVDDIFRSWSTLYPAEYTRKYGKIHGNENKIRAFCRTKCSQSVSHYDDLSQFNAFKAWVILYPVGFLKIEILKTVSDFSLWLKIFWSKLFQCEV